MRRKKVKRKYRNILIYWLWLAVSFACTSLLLGCAWATEVKLAGETDESYFGRGFKHLIQGEYNLAITFFNKAIELNPDYANAYDGRGQAYLTKGDYDQAIADFTKSRKTYRKGNPHGAEFETLNKRDS